MPARGIISLVTKAATGETNFYGVAAKDLQENIGISKDNFITGVLKFKENYDQFSLNPEEQPGNFLVLSFESKDAEKIETKIIGDGKERAYVDLTSDKYCVYRIKDASKQKIEVKLTKGEKEKIITYSLEKLVLSKKAMEQSSGDRNFEPARLEDEDFHSFM